MKKSDRENIRKMFDEKCAYCGMILLNGFHVDHVKPIYRGRDIKPDRAGKDEIDNCFPACPRCNKRKDTFTIEGFREEISLSIKRVRRDSSGFRMAEDYGLVQEIKNPVVFWFEKYKESDNATP